MNSSSPLMVSLTARMAALGSAARRLLAVQSFRAFGGVVVLACVVPNLPAQNLITNGGFEAGDFSSWTLTNPGYGFAVTTGSNHGDAWGAYLRSSTGASLEQTFATDIGQSYEVSFWLRIPNYANYTNTFTATVAGDTFYTGINLDSMTWTEQTHTFEATATSTLLKFYLQYAEVRFDLDDVSVTAVSAVPEPSTYAAFAGLGALGFVAWRRRQARV